MRTQDYSTQGKDARRILAGMILNPMIAAGVMSCWEPPGLFAADSANVIGTWAIDHFAEYGKPIGNEITHVFEEWAEDDGRQDDIVDHVNKLLGQIDYESGKLDGDPEPLLDTASHHFDYNRVTRAIEDAGQELSRGRLGDAHGILSRLTQIDLRGDQPIRLEADPERWENAFNPDLRKPVVMYPGAMGGFVGNLLRKGTLFAIQASDKVGKSFFLLDMAVRAIRDRYKVAYFEVGDLGEHETIQRIGQRAARKPIWRGEYKVPTGVGEDGEFIYDDRRMDALTSRGAYNAYCKLCRRDQRMRLICRPNSTINVEGIEAVLHNMERKDGWKPDVILIDYADILAPPYGVKDRLDQIDMTWKHLRRLSQQTDTLVLTATQASAAAYKAKGTQGKHHFGGRKTKMAEANGIMGLNQTPDEKANGIWRLNWIVLRSGGFTDQQYVQVAGCLGIGCPVLASK